MIIEINRIASMTREKSPLRNGNRMGKLFGEKNVNIRPQNVIIHLKGGVTLENDVDGIDVTIVLQTIVDGFRTSTVVEW